MVIDDRYWLFRTKEEVSALRQLDPQAKLLIEKAEAAGNPELYELDPLTARKQFLELSKAVDVKPMNVGSVENQLIPGPAGKIALRFYRPTGVQGNAPALIFFHGGGWVIGDLDSHDGICRWICSRSGCVVASVDYRMAPEHKFPAPLEDCLAATFWVTANGEALGIDTARIAVGGDSAGGNLAAVVSQQVRDQGGPPIAYQLLVYPATDLTMSEASHQELAEGYRLTKPLMEWFIDHYLNNDSERTDPRVSPLLCDDLNGLPKALVITAGFDPLRDEGVRYADKLSSSGVETTHVCYDGMIHGFFSMGGWLEKSREALDYTSQKLSEALRDG